MLKIPLFVYETSPELFSCERVYLFEELSLVTKLAFKGKIYLFHTTSRLGSLFR